jgi:hypothetical protein
MATQILESMGNERHRTCRMHVGPADYYCVRCNWRGDQPEDPLRGAAWHSCPVCRGNVLEWSRRNKRSRHSGIADPC